MNRRLTTFFRIIHTGIVNFVRNASLAMAAMAVMVVTLTILLFSLITNATFTHTIQQITDKIDVSVYLKDSVTVEQKDNLIRQLKQLPNVQSAKYLSKDDVLKQYERDNASNQSLLTAITETSNPLPATIHIRPVDLNKLASIKSFLSRNDVVALQSDPPSYSGDRQQAIDNITHATNVLREVGVVAIGVFAVISVLIIFNTLQMAIFNRRDEITIMRLLGASTSYIRGPFVVESIMYGVFSAIISVLIINMVFLASSSTLQASSLGLLDIDYANTYFTENFWRLLALQMGVGIIIGAASSTIATRRYLKFRTK